MTYRGVPPSPRLRRTGNPPPFDRLRALSKVERPQLPDLRRRRAKKMRASFRSNVTVGHAPLLILPPFRLWHVDFQIVAATGLSRYLVHNTVDAGIGGAGLRSRNQVVLLCVGRPGKIDRG